MSYRPTNIGALILVNPKVAAETLYKQLEAHDANLTHAAKAMGVSASTLHRWLTKLANEGYGLHGRLEKIRGSVS